MKKVALIVLSLMLFAMTTGCSLSALNVPANLPSGTNTEQGTNDGKPEKNVQDSSENKLMLNLYFANADNSALLKERREIAVKDGAVLKTIIEALLEGPDGKDLKKTIPDGTKLLGVTLADKVATVDLSQQYTKANDIAEIIERVSLVNTLTEVQGVEKVKILIEGKPLTGPSGMPFGELSRVALDEKGVPVHGEAKTVTLYFAGTDGEVVVAEKREVTVDQGVSIEAAAVLELIKGPLSKELNPIMPEGTRLLSVETSGGICKINLSKEFVTNNYSGTAGEDITLGAIVNTLTGLSGVEKVQFLVDGKIRDAYLNTAIDEPLTRNEGIIKK